MVKEPDSTALQFILKVDIVYQKFFREKSRYSRFKQRQNEQSYTTKNNHITISYYGEWHGEINGLLSCLGFIGNEMKIQLLILYASEI
jgi:hypothetical protein